MSQKRRGLSRLTEFVDVRNVVTQVVGGLVLLAVVAIIGIVLSERARDALEEVFTAEVPVWALVVALFLEAAFFGAIAWRARRSRKPVRPAIREVPYGNVVWPVTRYANAESYRVDAPICPEDKTQLGLLLGIEEMENPIPVGSFSKWRELQSDMLTLKCLKCSSEYDLRELRYGMELLLEIVEQLALSEERRRRS